MIRQAGLQNLLWQNYIRTAAAQATGPQAQQNQQAPCCGQGANRSSFNQSSAPSPMAQMFLNAFRAQMTQHLQQMMRGFTPNASQVQNNASLGSSRDLRSRGFSNAGQGHARRSRYASRVSGAASAAGQSALSKARSQIGVRERSGRNDGTPQHRYSGGRREPWCANFVAWSFRQAGKPLPGNQRSLASVQYMENQMKKAGKFHRGTPKPGDIIFFKNRGRSDRGRGRHVGMVERVANGRVYTIEGNSGHQVRRRSYSLKNWRISGYGRM